MSLWDQALPLVRALLSVLEWLTALESLWALPSERALPSGQLWVQAWARASAPLWLPASERESLLSLTHKLLQGARRL